MRTLDLANATAPLSQYARGVKKGPVILTTHGKPVAALILITNADLETVKLGTNPKFVALIQRSRARLKAEGGISSEEMRKRLGIHTTAKNGHRK